MVICSYNQKDLTLYNFYSLFRIFEFGSVIEFILLVIYKRNFIPNVSF